MSTKFTMRSNRRGALLLVGGAAATAAMVLASTVPAMAAPGLTDDGSVVGSVAVSSAISLTGLNDFTLTGLPGATVAGVGAVTMNVATNNLAGYEVTVQAATDSLLPTAPGNLDEIPIGALSVQETGNPGYTPLSDLTPTVVHTQATRSLEAGDELSNDYQVVIPFVNEDTYTVTLDYIATTL